MPAGSRSTYGLRGMRALVTGAGQGIGRAIAEALAAEGARIVVQDIDAEGADAACAALRAAGAEALAAIGSVADPDHARACVERIRVAFGGLDLLVNNAGIAGNRPTLEVDDDEWRRAMAVNLDGVFYFAREAGRAMVGQGGGAMVNVASIYGLVAAPERATYCASKAAVVMLTRVLAVEWARHGIRVNAVAPGYTETRLVAGLIEAGRIAREPIERRTPMGRLARPEEVAEAVLFLASGRAAYITGQVLGVDGGWVAYGYL